MPKVTLELPFPPSVNRIWRHMRKGGRGVRLSEEYRIWKQQADNHLLMQKPRGVGTWAIGAIKGPFTAQIILDEKRFGTFDLDNGIKAILDWAQRVEIVRNDKWCTELHAIWGETQLGCRLILESVDGLDKDRPV